MIYSIASAAHQQRAAAAEKDTIIYMNACYTSALASRYNNTPLTDFGTSLTS